MASVRLEKGNAVDVLNTLRENSVDSIVCDPPYELGFMNTSWDQRGVAFNPETWKACLRVLKPGGHLLAFGGARTYHRMACAIEDAGFEIRDQIMWIYGSGMPKSHNLHGDFEGWGTALKPAHEPIAIARKPFKGTVAKNMAAHHVGAYHIDACRVGTEEIPSNVLEKWSGFGQLKRPAYTQTTHVGRWPANVIHDASEEVLEHFPDAPGQQAPVKGDEPSSATKHVYGERKRVAFGTREGEASANRRYTEKGATNFAALPEERRFDTGSAARFFYCAKPSRKERNLGLTDPGPQFKHGDTLRKIGNADKSGNTHPTVKPVALMRYLCRLVAPQGGLIVDPFVGSGTTGMAAVAEGYEFLGIDLDEEGLWLPIAEKRIRAYALQNELSPEANAEKDTEPGINPYD